MAILFLLDPWYSQNVPVAVSSEALILFSDCKMVNNSHACVATTEMIVLKVFTLICLLVLYHAHILEKKNYNSVLFECFLAIRNF